MDTETSSGGDRPGPRALFLSFLVIGLSGFGGVLPFARRELVERRAWLAEGAFNETLALCQSLPGPNIVNLSVVLGSRFAGAPGALACLAGLTVAPVGLVLAVASLWQRYGALGRVPQAIEGLGAAAAGLVAATALKMARPAVASRPAVSGALMATAFAAVGLMHWPLVWVLPTLALLGVLAAWLRLR